MSNQQQQQRPDPIDPIALDTAITTIANDCAIEVLGNLPPIRRSVELAKGMHMMRKVLTDDIVSRVFMPLQGSRLGFKTDRENAKDGPKLYPIETVRECVIECMIRGAHPVGNEMNIIAGQAYFTKEFYDRKVDELEDVTDLEFEPSVPVQKDGVALVAYYVTWKHRGQPGGLVCDVVKVGDQMVDRRIPVRVNAGMGPDAILGKAKRKVTAKVYARITGKKIDETDPDAIETEGSVVDERTSANRAKTDDLINKHKASAGAVSVSKPDSATTQPKPAREMGEEG